MNIKYNIFRLGSIYKTLSRPINAINLSLPPLPLQYAKLGWCAAMTLRQYLVCRECRKVAQDWYIKQNLIRKHEYFREINIGLIYKIKPVCTQWPYKIYFTLHHSSSRFASQISHECFTI
jgi:hypothetical protein